MKTELIIAPCSYEASKFACENFHYSGKITGGKLVKYGVWENKRFIGVVIFGDSLNFNMGSPYGLKYTEICELRRVALTTHEHPVTEIISKCLKLLHKSNPFLQLVISYADKEEGHLGIIYQAGSWIYEGETRRRITHMNINGKKVHCKSVWDRYGTSSIKWVRENIDKNAYNITTEGKFKYIYPLTKKARKLFSDRAKPYPKSIKKKENNNG